MAMVAIGLGLAAVLAVVLWSFQDSRSDGTSTRAARVATAVEEVGQVELTSAPVGSDGHIRLTVHDAHTPIDTKGQAQDCVQVSLDGPSGHVETYGCTRAGHSKELVLSSPGEPSIGCAANLGRHPARLSGSVDTTSTFEVVPAHHLRRGTYDVEVTATTGIGDGCEPGDPDGVEDVGTLNSTVVVS